MIILLFLFYNTLFDENASCHLALGMGYTACIKDFEKYSLEECQNFGVNSSSIHVDFMIGCSDLSIIATLGACGASGVAGGSLLLIPMACSLFGIGNDVAMQVVAVGFIIGVVQDSVETALNSSGDAMFTIASEMHERLKRGEKVEIF